MNTTHGFFFDGEMVKYNRVIIACPFAAGQHTVKYPSGGDSTSDLMDLESADNCLLDAELDEPSLSLPPPQQPKKFNSCATVVRLNNNSIKRFSIETDV